MSNAWKKVPARQLRWFKLHARVRDGLSQALVLQALGRSQVHVAEGVAAALDPNSHEATRWEAQLLRRKAEGLELELRAVRRVAFLLHQVRRARNKLAESD